VLIVLLALVGFLDELSFGERMFDLEMPVLGKGYKVDAVHDLLDFLPRWYQTLIWAVCLGVPVLILCRKMRIIADHGYRKRLVCGYPLKIYLPAIMVLLVAAIVIDDNEEFAAATVMDMPLFGQFIEELLELNAALMLLAWIAASLPRPAAGDASEMEHRDQSAD
jgi:hypothetical protein